MGNGLWVTVRPAARLGKVEAGVAGGCLGDLVEVAAGAEEGVVVPNSG